jgi:hypothetical protein
VQIAGSTTTGSPNGITTGCTRSNRPSTEVHQSQRLDGTTSARRLHVNGDQTGVTSAI